MGKHPRYTRLVAAFATSAFALLALATVQYQTSEAQMAQIMNRASGAEIDSYQYDLMERCGKEVVKSKQRSIARTCRILRERLGQ